MLRIPFQAALARCRRQIRHFRSPLNAARYVTGAPTPQNALDIFKGEWWSRFPAPFAFLRAGDVDTFEDPRIAWALEEFGGVEGGTVLELGPLEGGHSYMLERAGAGRVIAIEAHPRAYLRCLVAKEIVGMARTTFLCGDFMEYLRAEPSRFDAAIASGVLYHMENPVELMALLAPIAQKVFFWTHYYDRDPIARNRRVQARFAGETRRTYRGFEHRLFRYVYGGSFGIGGPRAFSHWMMRDEILGAVRHFGFETIRTGFDAPDHPNGPAFGFVALRR